MYFQNFIILCIVMKDRYEIAVFFLMTPHCNVLFPTQNYCLDYGFQDDPVLGYQFMMLG